MFWNFPHPLNPAILHRCIRIQAFCNSLSNDRFLVVFKSINLGLNIFMKFRYFMEPIVDKISYFILFINTWNWV